MRSLFKIRTLPPQSSVKLVVELHPQFAQQELHLPSKRKDSIKKDTLDKELLKYQAESASSCL